MSTEALKLKHQLCFPLYALSRAVINYYRPMLDELDITYPQYLVLLLLWEHEALTVKALGEQLMLDSGTLTPLLKRLEQKELVTRERCKADERSVMIALTPQGRALELAAGAIPEQIKCSMSIDDQELADLKTRIDNLLTRIQHNQI
jgi:DNA-binding MarR family transcriptional regulator